MQHMSATFINMFQSYRKYFLYRCHDCNSPLGFLGSIRSSLRRCPSQLLRGTLPRLERLDSSEAQETGQMGGYAATVHRDLVVQCW